MPHLPSKKIAVFQDKILSWYAGNRRDLPWRQTRDPYKILVSEVMLQQTQVSRVTSKYEAWMKQFPTIEELSAAKTSDVLRLWSGLGYNRRALNLKKAIEIISKEHMGIWPREKEELKKLPGIGEYTARAVLCFAFDEQIAVVDTNVRRVILTQILHPRSQIPNEKEMQGIADLLLPKGKASDWNQALMDYAAVVLKREKIVIPKQSKFAGSNRYYRGKLLRLLLAESPVLLASVGKMLKADFSEKERSWLSGIISQMEREGFVRTDGKKLHLLS